MKIDVLIFYEHAPRELETVCLLKVLLQERGLSVIVRPYYFAYWESISKYSPKLVVVPFCYDEESIIEFSRFSGHGVKILNLHYEQISQHGTPDRHMPHNRAKEVFHVSWGPEFTEKLISVGVNEKFIFETGSTNIDFYTEKLKPFNKSKEQVARILGLNPGKRWILILSHFAYAFLDETNKQRLRKINKYTDAKIKLAQDTYRETLAWMETLARSSDELEVIYRPHPAELISSSLQRLTDKYPAISVCPQLVARDYIVNSDVIFTWLSTAAIEAVIARKEVYLLQPSLVPGELMIPILDCLPTVSNFSEFSTACNRIAEQYKYEELAPKIASIYKLSDTPAIINLADVVEALVHHEGGTLFKTPVSSGRVIGGRIKQRLKLHLFKSWRGTAIKKSQQIRDYVPEEQIRFIEEAYRQKIAYLNYKMSNDRLDL